MRVSDLLSDNDWDNLRSHLLAMREYTLTRSMGSVTLVTTVEPVRSEAWNVAMVIGIRVQQGDHSARQWFPSVEAARVAVRRWGGYG